MLRSHVVPSAGRGMTAATGQRAVKMLVSVLLRRTGPGPVTAILSQVLGSIVVSIPACHAGDRGSIPRSRAFCCSSERRSIDVSMMWEVYNMSY